MIEGADTLGELWYQFLSVKFSKTALEEARAEYADIGENTLSEEDELSVAEYLNAVSRMKSNKANGPDA